MSRKRSWVWQHFTRVSENLASCSICDKIMTCSDGSTTGIKRHLKTHKIVEGDFLEEAEDVKMERIEETECLVEVNLNPEELQKTRRSWVWNYFTKASDSTAKCGICEKVIRCLGSSTSGMAFHLSAHRISESDVERLDKSFEEEQFEVVQEILEEPEVTSARIPAHEEDSSKGKRSWVWNHFIKVSPLIARCAFCHKAISCKESSTSGMRAHLRSHNLTENSSETGIEQVLDEGSTKSFKMTHVIAGKDRSWVWNYFKKISSSTSRCEICFKPIKCSGSSTSGMRNHLKTHNLVQQSQNEDFSIDPVEESFGESSEKEIFEVEMRENEEKEENRKQLEQNRKQQEQNRKQQQENRKQLEQNRKQQCFVCDEMVGAFGTPLDVSLEFTNIPISELLESFGLGEPTKNFSAICLECLSSLKRYDEFQHHCHVIQNKITNMYQRTHSESIFAMKEELEGEYSMDENVEIEDEFESSQQIFTIEQKSRKISYEDPPESKSEFFPPIPRTNAVYQCDKCSKSFSVRSRMIRHLKSHRTGNKGLPCLKCTKICRSEFHLQTHVLIDHELEAEGPFECPTCLKNFSSKHQLKMHFYVHKPDKNWLCILCGKRFSHKSQFTMHMMIHNDQRPFTCEYEGCDKSFRTADKRKIHHRVHSGEKIYECPQCPGKRFAQQWGRDLHFRNFHRADGDAGINCNLCGIKVQSKAKLKQHQVNAHERFNSDDGSD